MFCSHCGEKLQAGQSSCPSCGKPVVMVTMPTLENRLARHLRLLAVLWIALSAIRLLGAGACLIVANFLFPRNEFLWAILSLAAGCLLVIAVAGFAASWGLLNRESWARILVLILAFIALLDMPFGTALGAYTLWVLLPSEAEREYSRLARPA